MPDQNQTKPPDTETAFVCDCDEYVRSACQGEPFFKEHEGRRFCVLHYPDKDKLEDFRAALKRKRRKKDYNFRGVWFPEEKNFEKFEFSTDADYDNATFSAKFSAKADFSCATFSTDADFSYATFSAKPDFRSAKFSAEADFSNAKFSAEADFSSAEFSAKAKFSCATFSANAYFNSATFSADANFSWATFSANADFNSAKFSANADFSWATFSADANFEGGTFKNYVSFAGSNEKGFGKQSRLNFQSTHIEKPERVSFHTLYLKPHWFINADCRKFEFIDCGWNHNLKQELGGATKAKISAPHRLLAITYRQLADNAEANHRYHEASRFRYNAFESRRIEKFRGFVPWRLDWWYWLASGYGESVGKAFIVFVALFALFAFGYGRSGFEQSGKGNAANVTQGAAIQPDTVGKPLKWKEAFVYSFNVSILQKPEPKPLTLAAKILVSLETVLGPAQAALLALAVRRRFMR